MKVSAYSRERDFLYFLEHKELITKRYSNQYVLLRGGRIVAACNSYNLAEELANRMFSDGLYYIQHCGAR